MLVGLFPVGIDIAAGSAILDLASGKTTLPEEAQSKVSLSEDFGIYTPAP